MVQKYTKCLLSEKDHRSVLSEGLPGVVFAETYTVAEGKHFTGECWFNLAGSKTLFCKNDCNKKNILVETSGNRAEKNRYSIEYDKKTNIVTVGIKNVQLSDSGQYLCKLERFLSETWWPIDGTSEFKIEVTKARSPVKSTTPRVPPVIQTTTAVRPTHSPGPNPGPSPSPDPDCGTTIRPEHEQQSEVVHGSSQTGSLLYIGVSLVVIVLLFSVALLLFYCKKKENQPKECPVNREFGEVPEGDREYEEVPERQVQSTSDWGSDVYSLASAPAHTQGDREYEEVPERQVQSTSDWGSDIYSLASAPAHTQVDSVLYSEVTHFSRNSALHSRAEAVVYSAAQTQDTPLYSTISALQ
ncbi:uncharacterized protein LOC117374166 [Periophthalmus magnuspinnatus]|uniref:uncharacterized protein LOC117374166 n=1 Tax=Periophthalmus magnuspinnatus TaxID=409849 RepID=UPI0024366109|nr:uncharacterized protein LOC117374166 [Periophthalmus magnuspinnatus]